MPLMALDGFKSKIRQCEVCDYKRVLCYAIPKEDFVAQYYHLTNNENWVCSEDWVKAKVHDPKKDEFTIEFNMGKKGFLGVNEKQQRHNLFSIMF
jgi:hypothetical protein